MIISTKINLWVGIICLGMALYLLRFGMLETFLDALLAGAAGVYNLAIYREHK